MKQQEINHAISLFKSRFGKTPEESPFPIIGIYKKQHAYLYGATEEAIAAYKKSQNIIRWEVKFYIWPIVLDFIIFFWGIFKFQSLTHPIIWIAAAFFICWFILLIVLQCIVTITDKKIKGKILFLNY